MSCPGLHCVGCSGKGSAGLIGGAVIVLVVADRAVTWVGDRIWWIGGTVAVCFALATAASMVLEARSERRCAAYAERHGIRSRADVIAMGMPEALPRPPIGRALTGGDIHIHLHGGSADEQAAVIRQAIGR